MIKQQFSLLQAFFRTEFNYFLFITAVSFLILTALGFAAGMIFPELGIRIMAWFSAAVVQSNVLDEYGTMNILLLFGNNLRAMGMSMCYGFIPFLYVPAVSLSVNSMLVGLFGAVYVNEGRSVLLYLAGILPHGIFEIPALVLSLAGGFYLCNTITRYVRTNEKGIVRNAAQNLLRLFSLLCLPLLIAAAVVEVFITPVIFQALM